MLHSIHPLAGQGFNKIIRDLSILLCIIKKNGFRIAFNSEINKEFEKITKHKNYIFSNSINLIQEFFNLERKLIIVL